MAHILPQELATNPAIHAASIGTILATLAHALPDLYALLPAIYYGLLILDHVRDVRHKRKHHRRHPHE